MLPEFNYHTEKDYAENLPSFDHIYAAQVYYYELRTEKLLIFGEIVAEFDLKLDYSPESLIALERIYFDMMKNNLFYDLSLTNEEFEEYLSIYFGEVIVRNSLDAEWVVREYPFVEGTYTMGIRSGRFTTHFQNLFEKHYLSCKDASKQTIYKRYLRMVRKKA
ncbi:hypothetical protein ACFFIX_13635 [Metabacillus herbersteinensis]|uniref:Uncharacterized protein n=1 Tax=Metabacillus herbersteinensis TaxID=283816 RepID=A0ABV6GFL8_9BACI